MYVVYITRYVVRIKKLLHNRIEIIEIESNRKEYESLHPYSRVRDLYSTANDLQPQMIPRPQVIPKMDRK